MAMTSTHMLGTPSQKFCLCKGLLNVITIASTSALGGICQEKAMTLRYVIVSLVATIQHVQDLITPKVISHSIIWHGDKEYVELQYLQNQGREYFDDLGNNQVGKMCSLDYVFAEWLVRQPLNPPLANDPPEPPSEQEGQQDQPNNGEEDIEEIHGEPPPLTPPGSGPPSDDGGSGDYGGRLFGPRSQWSPSPRHGQKWCSWSQPLDTADQYNMEQLMAVFVNITQSLQTSANNMNQPCMPTVRIQLKDPNTFDRSNPEKLNAFMTTVHINFQASPGFCYWSSQDLLHHAFLMWFCYQLVYTRHTQPWSGTPTHLNDLLSGTYPTIVFSKTWPE